MHCCLTKRQGFLKCSSSCDLSTKPAPKSTLRYIHSITGPYPFYSEFYADSESATFSRFTSIYWELYAFKVWPKSQKRRFLGNGLFWSESIGPGQGNPGPVLDRYEGLCYSVPLCFGRCLLCRYGAGNLSAPTLGR